MPCQHFYQAYRQLALEMALKCQFCGHIRCVALCQFRDSHTWQIVSTQTLSGGRQNISQLCAVCQQERSVWMKSRSGQSRRQMFDAANQFNRLDQYPPALTGFQKSAAIPTQQPLWIPYDHHLPQALNSSQGGTVS
jgi:hypothetical protein